MRTLNIKPRTTEEEIQEEYSNEDMKFTHINEINSSIAGIATEDAKAGDIIKLNTNGTFAPITGVGSICLM